MINTSVNVFVFKEIAIGHPILLFLELIGAIILDPNTPTTGFEIKIVILVRKLVKCVDNLTTFGLVSIPTMDVALSIPK